MECVAEPAFDLFPGLASARVYTAGFVLAPVGVWVRGVPGGTVFVPCAMALDRLTVITQMHTEIRQRLHQLLSQRRNHAADQPPFLLQLDQVEQKTAEVVVAGDQGSLPSRQRVETTDRQ